MRKISFLIVFLFATPVFAQWNQGGLCGTPEPSAETFAHIERMNELYDLGITRTSNQQLFVPLKIHVVQNSNGFRYDYNTMLTVICDLNQQFASSGIYFYLRGDVNVITNSNYFSHTSFAVGSQMMVEHNQVRVVNIYFVDLAPISLCGYANYPGTGAGNSQLAQGGVVMSISCSQIGNTTLAHELGHYFSLPHPFDGTSTDVTSPFAERVTRSATDTVGGRLPANCANFGDRFCDTPADYIGTRWNCINRVHNTNDLNGDTFQPDPALFMSYSSDFCMNKFSEQQMNAMRGTLLMPPNNFNGRGYLMQLPMPAWDTITGGPVTILEPTINSPAQPANWAFFRWTAAPGATQYLFRIRQGSAVIFERVLTDTSFLLNFNFLQENRTYNFTVRPFNHGWTCIPASTPQNFNTTQGYATSVFEAAREGLKVYPNQLSAGDQLNLRSAYPIESLQIVDQQGRVVHQQLLNSREELQSVQLPGLASGLYQLRLQSSIGTLFERIVVR
jgi:hypothetical protein